MDNGFYLQCNNIPFFIQHCDMKRFQILIYATILFINVILSHYVSISDNVVFLRSLFISELFLRPCHCFHQLYAYIMLGCELQGLFIIIWCHRALCPQHIFKMFRLNEWVDISVWGTRLEGTTTKDKLRIVLKV